MHDDELVHQEADLDEPTLLHETDLMLALLRAALDRPASLEEAQARLSAMRARAALPPCREPGDLLDRLRAAAAMLQEAGALAPEGDGSRRLTPRGRELLSKHPDGIDQSVLMQFPEFRAFIERRGRPQGDDDPRAAACTAGARAFRAGKRLTENPHALDTADHLAWQNGWSEAREGKVRGE